MKKQEGILYGKIEVCILMYFVAIGKGKMAGNELTSPAELKII